MRIVLFDDGSVNDSERKLTDNHDSEEISHLMLYRVLMMKFSNKLIVPQLNDKPIIITL